MELLKFTAVTVSDLTAEWWGNVLYLMNVEGRAWKN